MKLTRAGFGGLLAVLLLSAGCGPEFVQYSPSVLRYTIDVSSDPSLQDKAIFRILETQPNGNCAAGHAVNQTNVFFVTGTRNDISHLIEWQHNVATPPPPAALEQGPLLAGLDGNVYFQVVRSLPVFHYAFYPVGTHSLASAQDAKVGANAQVRLATHVVAHGAATLFALGDLDRTCSVVLSTEALPAPVSSPALYTAILPPSPVPSASAPDVVSSPSPVVSANVMASPTPGAIAASPPVTDASPRTAPASASPSPR